MSKLYPYRWQLLFLLLGILFVSTGIFLQKSSFLRQPSIEVISDENPSDMDDGDLVVVEVSGSVNSPGVYSLVNGSRIEDALKASGGLTSDADVAWISKYLNRAAPLSDGQKIYIPSQSEGASANANGGGQVAGDESQTGSGGMVNINTASKSELESLWGIGPATAESIIEQRMYSSVEELLSKGILNKNVYERNKDKLTIY